ncbi:WcbI family polysaccharide biosynthesis putative acetyltransferase [Humibacillus xanthopallidus]|uniref:WcbI family polysaccharide biosynthesis putative acetyltransferase n=1 Tax=Humibacillus xanthopallidus TaxID=412689 RepID=UPI00114FB667|nr:WcbI family polysaccharide biosynthesis putative acetyltransferase [Humibacillus xanthopallidus]
MTRDPSDPAAPAPDGARPVAAIDADPDRARHYGQFYGLDPLPGDDRPLFVVHGNCQAESLRQLLQQAPGSPWSSVRIPPVHELAADEISLLQRLLERADVVLTQPIADDYGGMPLGAAQVAEAASSARTVVWPVVFYAGLHPWQIVHHDAEAGDPPLVPYHDARTVLRAAGSELATDARAAAAVSSWSVDELRRREKAAGAVPVSDLVLSAGAGAMRTINHPANPVLVALARRLQEALGLPATAVDPGRRFLDVLHAPVSADVLVELGLDPAAAREDWLVSGEAVPADEVARAQLAWLVDRPRVVADIVRRHRAQLDLLAGRAPGAPSR